MEPGAAGGDAAAAAGQDDERRRWRRRDEALAAFGPRFEAAHLGGLRRKLGLAAEREDDAALAGDLLGLMAGNGADFTLTFRRLCDAAATEPEGDAAPALFTDAGAYDAWAARWRRRLARGARGAGGAPRCHAGGEPGLHPAQPPVEAALEAAVDRQDFGPFEELLEVVARPFEDRPGLERYAAPPEPGERVHQTFCGT